MGERTPLAPINAPASGRMAVAEALPTCWRAHRTAARQAVGQLDGRLRRAGEDADLYCHRQGRGPGTVPATGHIHPVGKDSLSMRTQWKDGGAKKKVVSPGVSLIVTAFATLQDVRGTLTPQLDATEDDTTLVLVDLGGPVPPGRQASWARCWTRQATRCPTWTTPGTW